MKEAAAQRYAAAGGVEIAIIKQAVRVIITCFFVINFFLLSHLYEYLNFVANFFERGFVMLDQELKRPYLFANIGCPKH